MAFGQSRALVVWQRIVMPNGSSVVIDNSPACKMGNHVGPEDHVDFHTWHLLKGIALSTLLEVGSEVRYSRRDESDLVRAIRESTLQSTAPDMYAIVEIKTDRRHPIEFLLSPLRRYKQESMRER